VKEYLKENVHQYGQTKLPQEMLLKATGEKFNPKYYIEYLKEKYTKLYNL
jgi:carboxypeptidase Taq